MILEQLKDMRANGRTIPTDLLIAGLVEVNTRVEALKASQEQTKAQIAFLDGAFLARLQALENKKGA